jgi:hypothetical protein
VLSKALYREHHARMGVVDIANTARYAGLERVVDVLVAHNAPVGMEETP